VIKFFLKISIMLILLVTGIGIIILIPLPENAYDLAIIDKHRILASTKSPKIVLAGGSNLAFGIDSAKIQNELHIPVVNMGFRVDIGMGRILDDILPYLNSGDILLVVPEYEHFTSTWDGSGAVYELIFNTWQYRLLSSSYYGIANGFFDYLFTHLWVVIQMNIITTSNMYLRNGFNEYGDYVKHLEEENQSFVSDDDLGSISQAYLNHFFQLVNEFSMRGITLLLSYPCYDNQSYRNSAQLIQKLDAEFKGKENLLVISSPASYSFPKNYFFNTAYHLNREGRSVRTGQLIQDLQASGLFPRNY